MYFENENILYNPRLKRAYPIREGFPVLLIDEAEEISEERHTDLLND